MNLSVAIITYNEEKLIERTLNAVVQIADEIVVVDSYSTDRTEEICRKFPKVWFFQKKFDGYGPQKNFALQQCNGQWIFFPDADEVANEELVHELKKIAASDPPAAVYSVELQNILLGKHLKYGGWGNVWRERFFKNGAAQFSDDAVHEKLIYEGVAKKLNGKIQHFTYRNISHHLEKMNRYSQMMAEKYAQRNKKSTLVKIAFSPIFNFIKSYFFQLGFLDGITGFYAAAVNSFYTFLKYMKLYELERR